MVTHPPPKDGKLVFNVPVYHSPNTERQVLVIVSTETLCQDVAIQFATWCRLGFSCGLSIMN